MRARSLGEPHGDGQRARPQHNSVLTLVERATGYTVTGTLRRHCAADAKARVIELIGRQRGRVRTITADNGTELHSYRDIEEATGVEYYFATPHHSWERGTNEKANGLIRQYLPKRTSRAHITQADCDRSPPSSTPGRARGSATRHRKVLCRRQVGGRRIRLSGAVQT